jgi:hypothetical protein
MPGHLQKHMRQGFMMAVEHVGCCVPEDPVFPISAEQYIVSFRAFYERGFRTPSHQLWYYDLELHHMNPSGVLQIVTLSLISGIIYFMSGVCFGAQ